MIMIKVNLTNSHIESILKAISWRIIASVTTFSVTYAVTKDVTTSTIISSFEMLIKIVIYYLHERFWLFIIKVIERISIKNRKILETISK